MRNLKADLEVCRKAPAGLWSRVKAIGARYWTIGVIKEHVARPFEGDEAEAAWNLIEAAREAWPEAIQRALAAEERVKELKAAIHAECGRCAAIKARAERPEDCNWDTCPLWPYRPKQGEEG